MDGIGEHHPAVVARALEAAEVTAQNLDTPKLAGVDRLAQPQRGRVETENVAGLQDTLVFFRQFGQLPGFGGNQGDGLLDEDVLAGLDQLAANRKMGLRGRHHHHPVNRAYQGLIVGGEAGFGQAEFARGLKPFGLRLGHVQLDGHGLEVAEMVHAPTA